MQDIHSIGGGRFFAGDSGGGGGGGGGDRRLRLHHQNHHNQQLQGLQAPQALKCPRCDSLNTKFCYYNNYNLSQPRHFCKNCRRYWTKGGVLRNVPVGGGCRKAKRSKPKPSSSSAAETPAPAKKSSNSHSSSESSSLTAATTTEALSTPTYQEPNLPPPALAPAPECGVFSGEAMPSLEYGSISPFRLGLGDQIQQVGPTSLGDHKLPEMADPVNGVGGGFGDWQQGLFDLGNSVDQGYWSQSQWNDQDPPSLYLP